MKPMRPKYQSSVSEDLNNAFDKIDQTAERLDSLKRDLNETAKEIAKLPSIVPSPEIKEKSRPGLYSIPTPLASERPGPVSRPRVPRPDPKPVPVVLGPPIRRASGRFFIQMKEVDAEELRNIKEQISHLGARVVDSGHGVSPQEPGWLEVAAPETVSELIEKIRATGLTEVVEKVVEVRPGEGRLQARQLHLAGTHGTDPKESG